LALGEHGLVDRFPERLGLTGNGRVGLFGGSIADGVDGRELDLHGEKGEDTESEQD